MHRTGKGLKKKKNYKFFFTWNNQRVYCGRWLHLIDFKSNVKFWKSESGLPMQNCSESLVSELIMDVCTGILTYICYAIFVIAKKVIKQYPCLADQNNYRKHCWIDKNDWSFNELEFS